MKFLHDTPIDISFQNGILHDTPMENVLRKKKKLLSPRAVGRSSLCVTNESHVLSYQHALEQFYPDLPGLPTARRVSSAEACLSNHASPPLPPSCEMSRYIFTTTLDFIKKCDGFLKKRVPTLCFGTTEIYQLQLNLRRY